MSTRGNQILRRPESVFEVVHREHLAMLSLLERVAAAPPGRAREMSVFELERQMTVHAAAEADTFFDALRMADDTRSSVRRALATHDELEKLVARLGNPVTPESAWRAMAEELRALLERHIAEETEIFEAARAVLSPEEARRLARDLIGEQMRLDSGPTISAADAAMAAAAGAS